MARSPRRRRTGGSHLPGHRGPTGPTPPDAGPDAPDEPELLQDLRALLRESSPLPLLELASSMLSVVDRRMADPFPDPDEPALTTPELIAGFLQIEQREATALTTALLELLPPDADEVMVQRVRRELRARNHSLPRWLKRLTPITIERTMVMSHVLGDGDNVLVAARTAAGTPMTAIVYIDHNLGTLVKDAFLVDEPVDRVVDLYLDTSGHDEDTTFAPIDPAEARASIHDAIRVAAMTYPPFETDTWPACRPLVERLVRELPTGGRGYERPEWSEAEQHALAERFLASPHGRAHADPDGRDLLESLLWYGCGYGKADPLRWSPVSVEILLVDWLPRKIVAPASHLARAPAVLRDLIRFGHDELGLRPALTHDTLAAVDEWEPEFRTAISDPDRPQGAHALLAALLGDDPDLPAAVGDEAWTEWLHEQLRAAVGGDEPLAALDDAPLPDEPFDWAAVPGDVHERVGEVLEILDRCCEELFDVEHRTACRRLLADVAAGDPAILRRRGRADTAAAAVAWIVGRANASLDHHRGELSVKALLGWFGLTGSVSKRAEPMLRAVGVDPDEQFGRYLLLGSPRYLVSSRRSSLVEQRDRLAARDPTED